MQFYFVERDIDGNVVGLTAHRTQQEDGTYLSDPEPFSEDHPEIVAFLGAHPPPSQAQMKTTMEQFERMRAQQLVVDEEAKKLQQWMLNHFQAWAELENALSLLLQAVVNCPGSQNVARAMYFSLGGFEARYVMVTKALQQFVLDNLAKDETAHADLQTLVDVWGKTDPHMQTAKRSRNTIAHGHILTIPHGGKHIARLTAPFADPIKFSNLLVKGSLPGMGSEEILFAVTLIRKLHGVVDRTNEAIAGFYKYGPRSLPKTIARLELNLQAVQSLK